MRRCTKPPPGWSCSRPAGHDGPCAAWPIEPREAFDRFVLGAYSVLIFLVMGLLVGAVLMKWIH